MQVCSRNHLTAIGNHMPYGIKQCNLPAAARTLLPLPPAEDGTRFSDPEGMQG